MTFSALANCVANSGFQLTIRPSEKYAGTLQSIPLLRSPSFNEEEMSDKPYWLQEISAMSSNQADCVETVFQNRLEALRSVDDLIKTIVETLEETKRLDNTVLIFTSDNGYLLGEHRLNQYKSYAYEESIRVPLYLRVPGFSGPQTIDSIVLNNDLAPTIANLANATSGLEVDGRSLIPLLEDPKRSDWRKRFLIEHYGSGEIKPPTFHAVRTGSRESHFPNYLYVIYEDEENSSELYDLNNDPYQLESLHKAESCGAQREYLEKWISELKECGNGSCQSLESSD
jgi:arylsulfatase A-like enzyme